MINRTTALARTIMAAAIVLLFCTFTSASTYNIGPGKTYTNIGDAPWSSLQAGDVVNIYPKTAIIGTTASASTGKTITLTTSAGSIPYGSTVWFSGMAGITPQTSGANWGMPWVTCGLQGSGLYGAAKGGTACSGDSVTISHAVTVGEGVTVYFTPPYFEKLIITATGTSANPILVQGVPDPTTGAMPTLDPHYATTGTNMAHTGSPEYHDAYGFVGLFRNAAGTSGPTYLTLKGIRSQGGRNGVTGYDATGTTYNYASGAGIRFEYADRVTIEANEIVDSSNGIFGAVNPDVYPEFIVRNITIKGNHFWYNSDTLGGHHQTYIEASNITYEHNWYDLPYPNAAGDQLKDRSAGTVIRYNYFYPGVRILDLIAAQNGALLNVPQTTLTVPVGGFASGATSLTFSESVSGISSGDAVGYMNTFTGMLVSAVTPGNPTVLTFSASYKMTSAEVGHNMVLAGAAGAGCEGLNGERRITATDSTAATVTIDYDSTGCSYTTNSAMVKSGWGYPGSDQLVMPTITAVNTATNTLTLGSGIPLMLPAGEKLTVIHRAPNPYNQTFVYGNVFDQDQSLWPYAINAIVHYGWDTASGLDSVYDRAGTLYFYNNTAIYRWNQSVGTGASYALSLFQVESSADTIRADNNLFYVTNSTTGATPTYLVLASRAMYGGPNAVGVYGGGGNMIVSSSAIGSNACAGIAVTGWAACVTSGGVSIDALAFDTLTTTEAYPLGLAGTRDYRLQANSSAINASTALPAAITSNSLGMDFTPTSQYGGVTRTNILDVGAYQYTEGTGNPPDPPASNGVVISGGVVIGGGVVVQ